MRKRRDEIDWSHWKKMNVVSLGEAVCLALEKDPSNCHDGLLSPFERMFEDYSPPSELKKMYDVAASSIGTKGGLVKMKKYKEEVQDWMPCVNLREFGKWINKKGYNIPDKFPTDIISKTKNENGTVSIEFPYECDFISKLAEIMFINYSNIPAGEKPNQKKVALEIDEAFGWPNATKNIKASPAAAKIATKIKPEKYQTPSK